VGYCLGALMAFITAARYEVDATVAYHGGDTEKYSRRGKKKGRPGRRPKVKGKNFGPPVLPALIWEPPVP
jgi:dienelactone hydrolase